MKKSNDIMGLDYFLMKTDFFHELYIRKLCHHGKGGQAAGIFITILCFLYQTGYYLKDNVELRRKIIHTTDGVFTHADLQETIQLALEIGLFHKKLYEEEQILTSREIQECYLASFPGRKKPAITLYNLINNKESEE